MLFNSFTFVFIFLPVTLIIYQLACKLRSTRAALGWLLAASLFFYGWWNPLYLLLLMGSLVFNYGTALKVCSGAPKRLWLTLGISGNLLVLGAFKYAEFAVSVPADIFGTGWRLEGIVLPIAVSFFTFQQIAYLVDSYKAESCERNVLRYCLFVTFYPQLIAGPIVLGKELIPQLDSQRLQALNPGNMATGVTLFVIGLAEKVLLADSLAHYAGPVYDAAARGAPITTLEAWAGTLAFAFQIYFDFCGYSNMALGLAAMVGIRLPANFDSPYRATSVIDFWRRWHMTLSRLVRDLLYVPLGGAKGGALHRSLNLMIAMLLAGLWHGAGWTFIVWGGAHGLMLVVNHVWRDMRRTTGLRLHLPGVTSPALTFALVTVAWVFFRAADLGAAARVFTGLFGLHGLVPGGIEGLHAIGPSYFDGARQAALLGLAAIVAVALPNAQQLMGRFSPAIEGASPRSGTPAVWRSWQPIAAWAALIGCTAAATVSVMFVRVNAIEFIYFQF